MPILAEMQAEAGCRVASLTHRLEAGRQPVRDAIGALVELGLVQENPGYGHPLRPEYILTRRGERVGPACEALMESLHAAGAVEVGLRKWSVATVAAVGLGAARFTDVARALRHATDRAVSQALGSLDDAGLIVREVVDGHPPAPEYLLSARGRRVATPATDLCVA